MKTQPHYPLPEAVDPHGDVKPWGIEPSGAFTPRVFPKSRVLQVPLDDSEYSRFMRNHELAHIRWSHKNPDLVARKNHLDIDVLQAVEDLRVNTKLQQTGIDVSLGALPRAVATAMARHLLRQGNVRNIILTAVASQGCGRNEEHFARMFNAHPVGAKAVEIAGLARRQMWLNSSPKFRDSVRIAKWLQLLLDGIAPYGHARRVLSSSDLRGIKSNLEQMLKVSNEFAGGSRLTQKVPWGRMTIETPPRPLRVAGYIGRRKTATDEGTLPRNIHRLLIDGRLFQRTRRGHGGTVLIDCSGSMSLTTDDLKKLLKHSPGACVAVYSGNSRDGVLRVLAASGRQVEDRWIGAPAGGANVIDGPALQWLSKQQKPRVWVCDGQVTGIHDRTSGMNTLECTTISNQRDIMRKNNVDDVIESLGRLGRI